MNTAWIGLCVAALAPLIVLVVTGHTGRFAAMLLFAALVPGTAVTCWLDTGDGVMQAAVTVAISFASYALATTILIWASAWHPDLVLLLAIPTGLSCLNRLRTAPPRSAGPIRRLRLGR